MSGGRSRENIPGERYDSNALSSSMAGGQVYKRPSSTVTPSIDSSKWKMIYPNYIDATKSIAQGRKVGKNDACDEPSVAEMVEVCKYFNIEYVSEPYRMYPRSFGIPGRIRVQIKNEEDGKLRHDEITCMKALMRNMGNMIPKLQLRKDRFAKEAADARAVLAETTGAAAAKKNKGKKKGRKK